MAQERVIRRVWKNYERAYQLYRDLQKSGAETWFANPNAFGIDISAKYLVNDLRHLTLLHVEEQENEAAEKREEKLYLFFFHLQALFRGVSKHCSAKVWVEQTPECFSITIRGGQDLHVFDDTAEPCPQHDLFQNSQLFLNVYPDRTKIFVDSTLIYPQDKTQLSRAINNLAEKFSAEDMALITQNLLTVISDHAHQSAGREL